MKMTLRIMAILFVFMLTGCGENYSYKETEFETVVIKCEKGTFHPDAFYITQQICIWLSRITNSGICIRT